MKNRIIVLCLLLFLLLLLSACGDKGYTNGFEKAIIKSPNGECIEIELKRYTSYSPGTLRIEDTQGNLYYTHSNNVLFVGGAENEH